MAQLKYKYQIDKIMKEFDFARVHRAMTAMKWTWRNEGVPTIERLKACAMDLLKTCKRKRNCSVSTGGFSAYCDGKYLSLSFTIEEANGYVEQ